MPLAIPALAAGCAGGSAKTEVPSTEASDSEVANLRRENATLRTRVQNLEERVRLIESGGGWAAADDGGWREAVTVTPSEETWVVDEQGEGGPRELPVVKLTPRERSIDSRPASAVPRPVQATRPSGSISLSPVPNSGVPEALAGSDFYVDAGGYDDPPQGQAAPAEPVGEPVSYHLVGSRLVEATKSKPKMKTKATGGRDRSPAAKDYASAMGVYKDGRYAEAEKAFAAVVRDHPNHDYADNALYWQGESAYDQAHYADALASFTAVVERYGGGNKAPDALLKIGLCYGRLGDADNARDVLTQLIAAYPRAGASKIAKRKLADF